MRKIGDFSMVDYEAVHKALYDGIMDAIMNIEKQDYRVARLTLLKAQRSAEDIFLEAGDLNNPIYKLLERSGGAAEA
jgi:hypothetical protein